uniref:Calponin-homology (CH) domain-containing protein n=1 Tax=Sinocyclocheilus anshuiensis TaxID=1608454 RepID=A0A671NHV3_9TELE
MLLIPVPLSKCCKDYHCEAQNNQICVIETITFCGVGSDSGCLMCLSLRLLNTIRPGLVKKINRLPTPVAALDNVALFLKGCLELGLKSSQLFDPGDLQDTSARSNNVIKEETETRSKNKTGNQSPNRVLINIYWLGRAANSSTTYNGPTLDLHKFEELLSQMRKVKTNQNHLHLYLLLTLEM